MATTGTTRVQVVSVDVSALEHARLMHLAAELRCLVCQNQSLADSNSGLAIDLRAQIGEQIHAGRSDAAIKQYMVERYGDFVLYNPPFTAANAALWAGPFLLLVFGAWLVLRTIRRRSQARERGDGDDLGRASDPQVQAELEARYRKDADA